MAMFYPEEQDHLEGLEIKKTGFPRYKEVLEGNWKTFLIAGFLTMVYFIPFVGGMVYAVLSKSFIVAAIACVVGGAIAGPGIACLYDLILRRLRDDMSSWWTSWKKATKNNWLASIVPGIIQCSYFGMATFVVSLMFYGITTPSLGTMGLLLLGMIIGTMIMTVWWTQIVLFRQSTWLRLKNSFFFSVFHLWKMLLCSLIQVVWWVLMILFLPWSALVVPFLGVWYIQFLSLFIIYKHLDRDFRVEDQIRAAFPGVLPEYEDLIPEEKEAGNDEEKEDE